MRFFLAYGDAQIPIGKAGALVGRSRACTVVLDGDLVSRRHAVFALRDAVPVVADLNSENGVFVNGERIEQRRELSDGDLISVGGHELRFIAKQARADETPSRPRQHAAPFLRADVDDIFDGEASDFDYGEPTSKQSRLMLSVMSASVAIRKGNLDWAESKLSPRLHALLEAARSDAGIDAAALSLGVKGALELARAKKSPEWLGHVFALHAAAGLPIPKPMLAELDAAVRECGGCSPGSPLEQQARDFAAALRARGGSVDEALLSWLDGIALQGD